MQINESKLSSLEKRFLDTFRNRYGYLVSKLHQKPIVYDGANFKPDFVLDLDSHPRYIGVCIECQGGIFQAHKSGHSTGARLVRDYEKCVLAQINGYFFLPVAPTKKGISDAIDIIDKLFLESQEVPV